jgi:hypothetical protein
MKRTPTLQAAAAALGVLAGFALSPADAAPLSGAVDEHAVMVAWDVAAPSPEPAGVPADDGPAGVRPHAAPPPRLEAMRAHPPVRVIRGDEAAQVKAHLTVLRMEKRRACPREQRQS